MSHKKIDADIPDAVGGVPIVRPKREAYDIKIPNIQIIGPRILVLPHKPQEFQTHSGIIVPEHAQQAAQKGLVLAVGDGVMLENGTRLPPRVEPGYEIIYARYAGVEIELDDELYLIVNESDIRCILTYSGRHFVPSDASEDN